MTWLVLTDDQVINELRERCRSERLAQNLSQGALAERAGLSRATVARFENDSNTPGLETLVAILRTLGGLEALEQVLPPRPIQTGNEQPPASSKFGRRPSGLAAPTAVTSSVHSTDRRGLALGPPHRFASPVPRRVPGGDLPVHRRVPLHRLRGRTDPHAGEPSDLHRLQPEGRDLQGAAPARHRLAPRQFR